MTPGCWDLLGCHDILEAQTSQLQVGTFDQIVITKCLRCKILHCHDQNTKDMLFFAQKQPKYPNLCTIVACHVATQCTYFLRLCVAIDSFHVTYVIQTILLAEQAKL